MAEGRGKKPVIRDWYSEEWQELKGASEVAKEVLRTLSFKFARAVRATLQGVPVPALIALEAGDTQERQVAIGNLTDHYKTKPQLVAETLARVMADKDAEVANTAKSHLLLLRFAFKLTPSSWKETLGQTFTRAAQSNHLPANDMKARYDEVDQYLRWESQQPR